MVHTSDKDGGQMKMREIFKTNGIAPHPRYVLFNTKLLGFEYTFDYHDFSAINDKCKV